MSTTGPVSHARMFYAAEKWLAIAGALLALLAVVVGTAIPAHATTGFTVSGSQILRDGQPWVPYGFTLSTFQDGIETESPTEAATVDAQLDAIKGAWHGNTVRLQIEQYEWNNGSAGITEAAYRAEVEAAITYAESIGLVVVINCQTEGQDGFNPSNNPVLPNQGTLDFWQSMAPLYANDPNVIIDPFNEPRYLVGTQEQWTDYYYVPPAGSGFIGLNVLIRDLRSYGYTSQLWIEEPGNNALTAVGVYYPRYNITSDVLNNVVYEYHHTQVDMNAEPSITGFNVEFGNLVTTYHMPVVDGEWTNRTVPYAAGITPYSPSGDVGQCWGDPNASIPAYLSYLAARGIGMTVWTLGSEPTNHAVDYINADGDNTTFTTANSYAYWNRTAYDGGCVTPQGGTTAGAGQLLMNWFAQQNGGA